VRSSAVDDDIDDIADAPVGGRDRISYPSVIRNMLVSQKLECAVVARLVPGWGASKTQERTVVQQLCDYSAGCGSASRSFGAVGMRQSVSPVRDRKKYRRNNVS